MMPKSIRETSWTQISLLPVRFWSLEFPMTAVNHNNKGKVTGCYLELTRSKTVGPIAVHRQNSKTCLFFLRLLLNFPALDHRHLFHAWATLTNNTLVRVAHVWNKCLCTGCWFYLKSSECYQGAFWKKKQPEDRLNNIFFKVLYNE